MPKIAAYGFRVTGKFAPGTYAITDRYGRRIGGARANPIDGSLGGNFPSYPPVGQWVRVMAGNRFIGGFTVPDPPPFSRYRPGQVAFTVSLRRRRAPHRYRGFRGRRPMTLRRSRFGLRGFGEAEEIIEEVVEEAAPAARTGLKTVAAVAAVGLIGAGLWFGLTKRSATGVRRYRGA